MPDVWQAATGQALFLPSGPQGNHLFFVILGPLVIPSRGVHPHVALVSVTTRREGLPHDPACTLTVGDHPFIRHDSYVAFRHLRLEPAAHVERMVRTGVGQPAQACSPELLERLQAGARSSRHMPREFKSLF